MGGGRGGWRCYQLDDGTWLMLARTRSGVIVYLAALCLLLNACGPSVRWDQTEPSQHIVRRGDTLYGIAWRYGLANVARRGRAWGPKQ